MHGQGQITRAGIPDPLDLCENRHVDGECIRYGDSLKEPRAKSSSVAPGTALAWSGLRLAIRENSRAWPIYDEIVPAAIRRIAEALIVQVSDG